MAGVSSCAEVRETRTAWKNQTQVSDAAVIIVVVVVVVVVVGDLSQS